MTVVHQEVTALSRDEKYMRSALEQAKKAGQTGEVPVGAVVVCGDNIIGTGFNKRESHKNALCHAELEAINEACKSIGGWRLGQCELYVTLEPCPMCAGAVINSRIKRVVYGACDRLSGACGSVTDLFSLPCGHNPECRGGVLENECSAVLSDFFGKLRKSTETGQKTALIFALDGTLWDSTAQAVPAWNSVLKEYGLEISAEKKRKLTGYTLTEAAAKLFPSLSDDTAEEIMKKCHKTEIGFLSKNGGILYPEAENTLKELSKKYMLFLVGSSTGYLEAFFTAHGLRQYFDDYASNEKTGLTTQENIRLLMRRNKIRRAFFVGNSEHDRVSSECAGVPFIYASYGSGKPKALRLSIDRLSELPVLLENLT